MIAITFDIAMFLSRSADCVQGIARAVHPDRAPNSVIRPKVRPSNQDCDPLRRSPTVYAAPARRYGLRLTDAFPLSASNGTDVCSCATTHAPPVLRKQRVERTH